MEYFNLGLRLIEEIESIGYQAFIIGGAVRDYLLNMPIHDIDIATNMPIIELKSHYKTLDNGLDYASVTIVFNGFKFEVTHFRKDIRYLDNRHPEIELVNDLKEDVKRRDFTINALAMNKDKKIIDYFFGVEDINNKIIKTILNPDIRFNEDSLRILRALYFSSKLNFTIEEDTLNSIIKNKILLKNLSNERIYEYFIKILYAKYDLGINYIHQYDLFSYIPKYKNWLAVVNKGYKEEDLGIYYYLKYEEFPPVIHNKNKKRCILANDLIAKKFNNYFLYKYQNEIVELFDVFSSLGYDIIEIKNRLKTLKIKSDKELALPKEEIAKMFQGKRITIAIEEIIKAILNNKIDNNKKSILIFLQGMDVVEC